MASHHHLCHGPPTTTSYCLCCSPHTSFHHPPPPPPECHLHPPPQPQFYSSQTHPPHLHQYHLHFQERSFQEDTQSQQTIASLLRRIAALESALRRCSSSSSHSLRDPAARTIQTHFRAFLSHRSRTLRNLKELASIKSKLKILKSSVSEKTHFDYDVVYQKAVDLLRKLDTIESGDSMIRKGKSSLRRHLNRFLDFLDGFYMERRVVSSGVNVIYGRNNVKYRGVDNERKMSNVKCGELKNGNSEKLRKLVERIDRLAEELGEEESEVFESNDVKNHGVSGKRNGGLVKQHCGVQAKPKKSVTFADNGKVYRVLRRNPELVLNGDYDDNIDMGILVNAMRDLEGDLCREVEEIGISSKEADDDDVVEAHDSENEGSQATSDDDKDPKSYLRSNDNFERGMYNPGEADNFAFSAPLPLKMESLTRGRN